MNEINSFNSAGGSRGAGRLREINLTNDGFFALAMQDTEFCKTILSIILGRHVTSIEYLNIQETLQNLPGYKTVRLDVFAKLEDGSVYNVEMQLVNKDSMPRRARYYQSLIDTSTLLAGKTNTYSTLPKSVVIFITDFDIFGYGYYKYSFTNKCTEIPGLELGDETEKIFLNLKGSVKAGASDTLIALLRYLKDTNSLNAAGAVKQLDTIVERLRANKGLEEEFMRMDWIREEGIEKGREEGREEGIRKAYEMALKFTDEETAIRMTAEEYNLTKERLREILTLVEI